MEPRLEPPDSYWDDWEQVEEREPYYETYEVTEADIQQAQNIWERSKGL